MAYGLADPTLIVAGGAAGGMWEWVALSGLAVGASTGILAFMYAWATIFRNPSLEGYVRQELYELVVTGALMLFIVGLVGAMGGLKIGNFIPAPMLPDGVDAGTNVYAAAVGYYERVTHDMEGWLNLNYFMNILIDQMASVTPYARPLGVGLVASPMAGFASPIKSLLYNMCVGLAVAYIINVAQMYVFVFALQAFLKYYLPLGLFLRCFTPTRRLGGTLIGIGMAFLFVFPALSVVTYTMFYGKLGGPLLTFGNLVGYYVSDQGDFKDFAGNFFKSRFTTTGTASPLDIVTGTFGLLGGVLQGITGNVFLMFLILPTSVVSMAFALGFVIPAFNVILFTEAAKGLARAFGEEVDISSLTRLI